MQLTRALSGESLHHPRHRDLPGCWPLVFSGLSGTTLFHVKTSETEADRPLPGNGGNLNNHSLLVLGTLRRLSERVSDQSSAGKSLPVAVWKKGLICSVSSFLWCKYSRHRRFQVMM